jgi:hypothetical protein
MMIRSRQAGRHVDRSYSCPTLRPREAERAQHAVRVGAAACMAGLARGGGKREPIEDDREMAPVAGGVVGRRLFSRTKLGKGKHACAPAPHLLRAPGTVPPRRRGAVVLHRWETIDRASRTYAVRSWICSSVHECDRCCAAVGRAPAPHASDGRDQGTS